MRKYNVYSIYTIQIQHPYSIYNKFHSPDLRAQRDSASCTFCPASYCACKFFSRIASSSSAFSLKASCSSICFWRSPENQTHLFFSRNPMIYSNNKICWKLKSWLPKVCEKRHFGVGLLVFFHGLVSIENAAPAKHQWLIVNLQPLPSS